MTKLIKLLKYKNSIRHIVLLLVGIVIGWILWGNSTTTNKSYPSEAIETSNVWTCSMHPQIRKDVSGDCPICGMDLIIHINNHSTTNLKHISLDNRLIESIGVQTSMIKYRKTKKEIFLQGKLEIDERKIFPQIANFSGRIEKVYIGFEGQRVKAGDPLVAIYSPSLYSSTARTYTSLENEILS